MVTATFGTKKFEVSSKKIYTPNGLSISEELNLEETEVSGKKPTVTVKGINLMGLSFELKLDARFVDVNTEIAFWKNTLKGKKAETFKLGNMSVGKFYLSSYSVKDIKLGRNNDMLSAMISLSFIEYNAAATTTATTTTKKTTTVKASATTSTKNSKYVIGAICKPKSGTRWYETALGALNKSGKSGKAYQQNLKIYNVSIIGGSGQVGAVNLGGLGWMKVSDVTLVTSASTKAKTSNTKAYVK